MANPNNYTVNLFVPCCMDLYFPQGVSSLLSIMESLGDICYYNSDMTCCGRQFFNRGEIEFAKQLSHKMIRYFDNNYPVVAPSSACIGYIKKHYKELCATNSVPASVERLVQNSYELCDYIVNVKGKTCMNNTFKHRVFYFESCAARNVYHAGNEAITLLENTEGLTLLTDPEMKLCCCGNGDFAMHNDEMTQEVLKRIIDRVLPLNAEFITSTDLHCLQYLDAYLQEHSELKIKVAPMVEILCAKKPEQQ